MSASARPPWKKPNPAKKAGRSRKLASAEKEEAKAAAKKAGRSYPNLVDNMHVASKRRTRSAAH